MSGKINSAEDAVAIIQDGDVLATNGYGGNGMPEQLLVALEARFKDSGTPRDLTLVCASGQGDAKEKGLNHLGHEGLLKRVIGGYYGLTPKIEKLAVEEKIEAYNLPEGVIVHLYRDIAAGKPGTISKVGLGTFIDPRIDGGKVNASAKEDLVRVMEFDGQEYLFFKAFPIDIAFVRGTTADTDGNITMERESLTLENLSLAIAAKNSGGYVICQVERIAAAGSLDSRQVRIPGILVDCVVVAEPQYHMQTYGTQYNPGLSGEVRVPLDSVAALPLDARKVIARRAAMEIGANSVVNMGLGLPDAIGIVANEEKIHDLMTLTVDPGIIGGVPLGGQDFGAAVNCSAVIDHASQFDFIDGGGLDACFLGLAQCDRHGNVNASRFAGRVTGCGGFIDLSQNSRKVVFVSNLTAGGLETEIADGKLRIVTEGKHRKFIDAVEQITFSGKIAAANEQEVYYVTERCVFRLGAKGLRLIEVAPGIDVEADILAHLDFTPEIDGPALMDPAIFLDQPMGLKERLLDIGIDERFSYDAVANTLYINFAGMRVRTVEDVNNIAVAVEAVLKPLGKRVISIVNYDGFVCDEDVMDEYADLVRRIETTYYIKVSRYSNSAFLRLKLGKELAKRHVSSHVFETPTEAKASAGKGF